MKPVEIPGGNAQLREKHEIKVRHRRLIEAASVGAAVALSKLPSDPDELETATLTDLKLTKDEAGSLFELQDATIVAALDSWTRPEAIPTLATVGDLDPEVYDALAEATSDLGTAIISTESFDPPDPQSPGFASSPTLPSSASEAALRDDPEPASTDTQPTNTSSGVTDESSQDSATSNS